MYTYLFDKKQRTKTSIFYSSWQNILCSIPWGSILGPLLFKILFCDLYLIINKIDFASYPDDKTPYIRSKKKIEAKTLLRWFSENQMKANPNKCHLLVSSKSQGELKIM